MLAASMGSRSRCYVRGSAPRRCLKSSRLLLVKAVRDADELPSVCVMLVLVPERCAMLVRASTCSGELQPADKQTTRRPSPLWRAPPALWLAHCRRSLRQAEAERNEKDSFAFHVRLLKFNECHCECARYMPVAQHRGGYLSLILADCRLARARAYAPAREGCSRPVLARSLVKATRRQGAQTPNKATSTARHHLSFSSIQKTNRTSTSAAQLTRAQNLKPPCG
jgi:hypothetical protein